MRDRCSHSSPKATEGGWVRHLSALKNTSRNENNKWQALGDRNKKGWSKREFATWTTGIKGGESGRDLSCPGVPHGCMFSSFGNKHLSGLKTSCLASDFWTLTLSEFSESDSELIGWIRKAVSHYKVTQPECRCERNTAQK